MNVGENIKKYRQLKKLTQKQLGEIIGKSEISIRKYESESSHPPLNVLYKIAEALNIDINKLIISYYDTLTNSLKLTYILDNISIKQLSLLSRLPIYKINRIISNLRGGYNNDDIIALGKVLNLNDKQINEWIKIDNQKPVRENNNYLEMCENVYSKIPFNQTSIIQKKITNSNTKPNDILDYWRNTIINYPNVIDVTNIENFSEENLREIANALDITLKLKVKEISQIKEQKMSENKNPIKV